MKTLLKEATIVVNLKFNCSGSTKQRNDINLKKTPKGSIHI